MSFPSSLRLHRNFTVSCPHRSLHLKTKTKHLRQFSSSELSPQSSSPSHFHERETQCLFLHSISPTSHLWAARGKTIWRSQSWKQGSFEKYAVLLSSHLSFCIFCAFPVEIYYQHTLSFDLTCKFFFKTWYLLFNYMNYHVVSNIAEHHIGKNSAQWYAYT